MSVYSEIPEIVQHLLQKEALIRSVIMKNYL